MVEIVYKCPAGKSPATGRVLGLGDEIEDNVLVPTIGRYVQGAPAIPVCQSDVCAKLDQKFHQLQVAVNDGLVQSRLTLWTEGIDVKLTVSHILEKGLELLSVPFPYSFLEHPLGVRNGAGGHFCLAHGWEGSRWMDLF